MAPTKQHDIKEVLRHTHYIFNRLDIKDSLITDWFDINYSLMQSIQKTLIQIIEKRDRPETMVCALHIKVFGPERGPVVETFAGFSSTAQLRYPQTDANDDNNISRRNNMAIHPVSGQSTYELRHHVHLRRDEHPKHYHLNHFDRLSNCSTWTPAPVSQSRNDAKGTQEVSPHCHDGSGHPQQSPSIEMHTVAPHTRCIGTSDSTSHTTYSIFF